MSMRCIPENLCISYPIWASRGERGAFSSKSNALELKGGSYGKVGCESCFKRYVFAVFLPKEEASVRAKDGLEQRKLPSVLLIAY